ncbi:AbrB/MazE/SpoVT family DNA-binding domain-containing protein [Candidatus Woesearchaeota archaeon]|nr:AbrB/MazE/SpoVT family DNA-binding domain-containing protein [Candidatus Woesearchaeota archaeon]
MKLQKQKTDYKRGYSKYVIVIPKDLIKKSELKESDELIGEAEKHKIIFKKVEK